MKTIGKKNLYIFIIISISLLMNSCRSSDANHELEQNMVTLNVTLSGSSFDNIINQKRLSDKKKVISINKDYLLEAKLNGERFSNIEMNSGSEITPLPDGIAYRLLVYDKKTELFVKQIDYISGRENEKELLLDGGKEYIFIAYSNGNAADFSLPVPSYSDNSQFLSMANITINGNTDFMYFRKDDMGSLSGDHSNNLNITFKHMFSQITTRLDSSMTGYDINEITAHINPNSQIIYMNLSSGDIKYSDGNYPVQILFPIVNSNKINSLPTLIVANTTTGIFRVAKIVIGPLVLYNLNLLTDLAITPGIKYNLNLRIIPKSDIYIDNYNNTGYNAVQIQGQVWMRHNLGANMSLSPDIPNQEIAGSYYKWGEKDASAKSTDPVTGQPWDQKVAPNNAWTGTGGTEENPIKNSINDPCPSGWRIPTRTEWLKLYTNTVSDNIGENRWSESDYNFENAKIFRSMRNFNIKLTFPASGYYLGNGTLVHRADKGYYWSSTEINDNTSSRLYFNETSVSAIGAGSNNRTMGFPIRCIAE